MNISEIASKAQVSRATVSRVINNFPGVKEETRERILRIIKEENFVPNSFARSLALSKSYVIGVLVYSIKQPFWVGIVSEISDAVFGTQYSLFILNSKYENNNKTENTYKLNLNKLIQQKVDGIIVSLPNRLDEEDLETLQRASMPFVVIQDDEYESRRCHSVNVDNRDAAYRLTEILIQKGHKDIVHFAGGIDNAIAHGRLKGFTEAMNDNILSFSEQSIINTGSKFIDGYWSMKKLIDTKLPVSAVVAYNDMVAYGAYYAAQEIGIRIPEDISIVGFDGIAEELDYYKLLPDLTTMKQPIKLLGTSAVTSLMSIINGEDTDITNKVYKMEYYQGSTIRQL